MIKVLAVSLSVMFLLVVLGCGGGGNEKPSGINLNPDKKSTSTPPKPKPEPPAEIKWLGATFGKYFDDEGMKKLMADLPTMSAEDFEATLRGLEKDGETPSEEDITKAIEFFNAWKAKEAEKAAKEVETPAEESGE